MIETIHECLVTGRRQRATGRRTVSVPTTSIATHPWSNELGQVRRCRRPSAAPRPEKHVADRGGAANASTFQHHRSRPMASEPWCAGTYGSSSPWWPAATAAGARAPSAAQRVQGTVDEPTEISVTRLDIDAIDGFEPAHATNRPPAPSLGRHSPRRRPRRSPSCRRRRGQQTRAGRQGPTSPRETLGLVGFDRQTSLR